MTPSEDYEMALYPHLPSPTGSIPWQDLGSASKALFRLRGVQTWEAKVGKRETAHMEENMESLPLIPLTSDGAAQSVGDALRAMSQVKRDDGAKMIVKYVQSKEQSEAVWALMP